MKILLIGANGTVGSAVKAELAQRHEVISIGRTQAAELASQFRELRFVERRAPNSFLCHTLNQTLFHAEHAHRGAHKCIPHPCCPRFLRTNRQTMRVQSAR